MTDRTDHRAAAERLLADADEWAAQAGELSPKASERACLDRAAVHALLAIHDTLTAADRYATNEERQREIIADYAGQPVCGRCGRDAQGREWPNCSDLAKDGIDRKKAHDATCERYWGHGQDWVCDECEAEMREGQMDDAWQSRDWETVSRLQDEEWQRKAGPDPLDENDHRDRLTADRLRIVRNGRGHWHWHTPAIYGTWCDADCAEMSLRDWARAFGPLAFAPDTAQDATGGDLSAPEGENGSVDGEGADDAPEALLCPECGEGIIDHPVWDDARFQLRCRLTASEAVRALIEQAVEQPRSSK